MPDVWSSSVGSSESIAERVRGIVARTCGRRTVSDRQDLSLDLQLGSVEMVELLMALELAFRIEFRQSDAEALSTVRELIAMVERKTGIPQPGIGLEEGLMDAVKDLAAGAASAGETIDVFSAALSFSEEYPRNDRSIEEICDEIVRAAAEAGAKISPNIRKRSA